ncbi:MAG: DUF1847 domain-containing protein [Deltaproteobacteria bacterium]|nr:DUF1847 domain-containing protein [Deltaproteobacteria bacterium]MBW1949315.1 DUF1847 domain-containing protein [Deltaproteobacteria bacterium]MBW2009109.1 DUF1847 domain-containing protein [Deltaproteobacteria bacterium]MBW2103784.1 DUF1847 domain-containing protein [Deltaproteobacteria bacterium]MBW2349217.1 DUF1847 domain-containing protein [Deltaproteobacteria bacterium]
MTDQKIQCSYCAKKRCFFGDLSRSPDFCPTNLRPDTVREAAEKLRDPENSEMARAVALTWKEDYGRLTRVEETVRYARIRGYEKLGVAFCVGLSQEAELLTNLLINEGFDVVSVCCMCGGISSEDVDLPDEDKIMPGIRQPMCNPIGQAALLDEEGSELNILLGLCVGDDTLFIKHSKAPVTVLAVKDRVLAHNPLGALYTARHIYTRLNTRKPKKDQS